MERTTKTVRRLVGLGLIALGGTLYLGSLDTPPREAHLLADVGGEIELVVGHAASARRSALRNAHLVTEVVNGLPARVGVLLTTNDRHAFSARNPGAGHVRFVALATDREYTIWPQDPFLVLEEEDGGHSLLASREFERANDDALAAELGAELDWPVRVSTLNFEGGNIVSDDETIFVGANTIYDNAITLEMSEPEVVERFERELGRTVLVVGPWPQPVGHIDMMMTPTRRTTRDDRGRSHRRSSGSKGAGSERERCTTLRNGM